EPGERLAADAVAFVEATRQMAGALCGARAQEAGGERGGGAAVCAVADTEAGGRGGGAAVDVVVAMDADPAALLDSGTDLGAGDLHVAKQERVVRRLRAAQGTERRGGTRRSAA